MSSFSVMSKTVAYLFLILLLATLYWRFFNPGFNIFPFIKWSILITAFIELTQVVRLIFRFKTSKNFERTTLRASGQELHETHCAHES